MSAMLQSLSSLFSTSSARQHAHLRRDQAMSSVDDAFSVPPGKSPPPSAAPSSPSPPSPDSDSPQYTYPPPAQGYDTVPVYDRAGPSRARARPAPLLPVHRAALAPRPYYPPLHQTWARLRAWLDTHYPELADTLNWGLPAPDLAHLELQLDLALPPAVRDSYLLVDGQEAESAAGCPEGLFFGLTLLPFDDVVDEWRFWREVDHDPATGANPALRDAMRSLPPGWIRREYSQRGWLPLVADKAGNYLGVDMNPDERGAPGQVIVFGRDFDTKVVLWRGDGEAGWARWLAAFVDELESGEGFELGGLGDGSEGSEDDLGYESYFFDGTGKGEGGADGSAGGLRLTGEYRGWPVLEAFADRSMKRWIEAGVMEQPSPLHVASPNAIELGLEPSASTPKTPAKNAGLSTPAQENGEPLAPYAADAPSIAVTKPPAPLPVQLPTERDLLPSPTFSSPTEADLEYGPDEDARALPMREIDARTTPVQTTFAPAAQDAPLVPLASPDALAPARRQPTDPLVTESHALLAATPELASPAVDTSSASQEALSAAILTPTPVDPSDPPGPADADVPPPSVRLVRGRGGASLVDGGPDLDKKLVALDADEAAGGSAKRKTEVA